MGHVHKIVAHPSAAARAPHMLRHLLLGIVLGVSTLATTFADSCLLSADIDVTEVSFCGKDDWVEISTKSSCNFGGHIVILGETDCDTGKAVPKYEHFISSDDYEKGPGFFTVHDFLDVSTGKATNIKYKDVTFAALCNTKYNPQLSWDGQSEPDVCTALVNIVAPFFNDCKWGDFTFGVPSGDAQGGGCELEEPTPDAVNAQCANSDAPLACQSKKVLITEVDGDAKGSGADWVEVYYKGNRKRSPTCELRGCQFIFSECGADGKCKDITPYTDTRVDFNLSPKDYALFHEDHDFVPPRLGLDYIPGSPSKPLTVALCCESGFEDAWDGDSSKWSKQSKACTSISGIGDTTAPGATWGRAKNKPKGNTCLLKETKECLNGKCV
ncbi:hypothetical protein T492DRAFT_1134692 [Pavlovales sp. CCMP2436]|nr:hypothetical protein T492DRAFT_1134692 [Pavlovales sp. CCMP2436]